jgi:hypothetical protein
VQAPPVVLEVPVVDPVVLAPDPLEVEPVVPLGPELVVELLDPAVPVVAPVVLLVST